MYEHVMAALEDALGRLEAESKYWREKAETLEALNETLGKENARWKEEAATLRRMNVALEKEQSAWMRLLLEEDEKGDGEDGGAAADGQPGDWPHGELHHHGEGGGALYAGGERGEGRAGAAGDALV